MLVYIVGLHFALRVGTEHYRLGRPGFVSQITFELDDCGIEWVEYREDPLQKTIQGGIGAKMENKVVHVYPSSDPERCPVHLLKKYCNLLPPPKSCQKFYLRPKSKFVGDVWYCDQPYGDHKIGKTIKELCNNAGLVRKFTNYSLYATSTTCMYDHDIPKQIIQEITGHQSECVYNYKRTSDKKGKRQVRLYLVLMMVKLVRKVWVMRHKRKLNPRVSPKI